MFCTLSGMREYARVRSSVQAGLDLPLSSKTMGIGKSASKREFGCALKKFKPAKREPGLGRNYGANPPAPESVFRKIPKRRAKSSWKSSSVCLWACTRGRSSLVSRGRDFFAFHSRFEQVHGDHVTNIWAPPGAARRTNPNPWHRTGQRPVIARNRKLPRRRFSARPAAPNVYFSVWTFWRPRGLHFP